MDRELVRFLDKSVDLSGKYGIFHEINGLVMIKNEKTYEKYCDHALDLDILEKWLQNKCLDNPILCPACNKRKAVINLDEIALENNEYRKIIYTDENSQLVVMSIYPQEGVPLEIHEKTTQFIRIVQGIAEVIINGEIHNLRTGDAIFIPMGTKHEIINNSKFETLKLYTIYSPPVH